MDGGGESIFHICDLNETFIFMSKFSMEACPHMKYGLVVQRKEGHIFSPTRPHWAELVIESPCPYVCMYVCVCVCAIAKHPLPEVV